ncbi:MAG: hypothetical protein P4L93_08260 [Coriobacteriia bacterium]|nr:hypothetical protein [Coriobacteriia bacterium]
MRTSGLSGLPDVIEVSSEADAALGYRGSASVVIDGADVDERMVGTPSLQWG